MTPPDTEAAQEPVPEDLMRRVAREEAEAVYDEMTATDADGESWSLRRLMDTFGLSRRQALKALGLIAIGYGGAQAAARALIGTAQADSVGQVATEADPLTKLWTHEIESGDGADVLTHGDAIQYANEAVSSSTTIGNVTFVYYDSSVAGFTITIPASLEKDGVVLYFIDTGGSAASNNVDVTSTNWNVDGSGTKSIDASNTAYVLYSFSGEWRSQIFTERVDAGTITTGQAVIDSVFRLPATTVTISSGSVSYDAPTMVLNGEGGNADTLNSITGAQDGDIVILESGDAIITVAHESGGADGFQLDGDANMTVGTNELIALKYSGENIRWLEMFRNES